MTQQTIRARDLGIPFSGTPGKYNGITDVTGVEVGHTTLISGKGKLVRGKGPVRTGVTAILPRGKNDSTPVFASWFTLNGNGSMTGTAWLEESGFLEGPIMITNTHSVGVVRDAVVEWSIKRNSLYYFSLPVVAETWDGTLSDLNGFHVKKQHAFAALDNAVSGVVAEGNVGGGTGMIVYDFKGGIGTASRKVGDEYTLGVLVQANYGNRDELTIAGVPVGKEIPDLQPEIYEEVDLRYPFGDGVNNNSSSIIVVVATDAPLLPHQLKAVTKHVSLGLGRNGSIASINSGDIFIAFSTEKVKVAKNGRTARTNFLLAQEMDPIFKATVEATEEAIINAMVAAKTMVGINDNKVYRLPHQRLQDILKKYRRLDKR